MRRHGPVGGFDASDSTSAPNLADTPGASLGSLGDRVWLVLGGGGLKGLAHIGAWRAFSEAGVQVQGVVGTSIGALVGAFISAGTGWEELRELARGLTRADIVRVNRRAVWINGIRQTSVFRGDVLREYYERILPPLGWEALRLPLQVNAVNLATGTTEWFGPGAREDVSLVDAVYASSALPVFYPPAELPGGVYVDGGAEWPLALERAVELKTSGIIGIDVGAGETADPEKILARGMLGVHQRIFAMMTWRARRDLVEEWEGPPLFFVRPALAGYDTFDFENVEYFIQAGYDAAMEALGGG